MRTGSVVDIILLSEEEKFCFCASFGGSAILPRFLGEVVYEVYILLSFQTSRQTLLKCNYCPAVQKHIF